MFGSVKDKTDATADRNAAKGATPFSDAAILANAPYRIGEVTLIVRDLAKVTAFYREVIGLKVIAKTEKLVQLGAGSSVLINLRHEPTARFRSPRGAGLFHTAFLLPSRSSLGSWTAFAAEKRFPIQGASDHLVSEAIYLADPEGNGIEIYADRPSAAWPVKDGEINMPSDMLDVQSLLRAGAGQPWTGFPEEGFVGHMHLQVGAIPAAEAFYRDLLGFDVTCRYPGGTFYGAGGYHHQIATNVWNSRGAAVRDDLATGLSAFELLVSSPDVMTAAQDRLATAAHPVTQTTDGLVTRDPWGLGIQLKHAAAKT